MLLWRLSIKRFARAFHGGYGMLFHGRWNTKGHAVTYCATSPSLCVLEKLVHIEDARLLPALVMVRYEVPDHLKREVLRLSDLPEDWRLREGWTQGHGDRWHEDGEAPLLCVPSAVIPLEGSPDMNVVINHRHPDVAHIRVVGEDNFDLDMRLL